MTEGDHELGSGATLLLLVRTPSEMMTYAHWPFMVWTSPYPLGQSGSWEPASSASSTPSLIGTIIALVLPWLAEGPLLPG